MHVSSTLFRICPNNQPDNSCLRTPRYHGQLLVDLGVLKIHTFCFLKGVRTKMKTFLTIQTTKR